MNRSPRLLRPGAVLRAVGMTSLLVMLLTVLGVAPLPPAAGHGAGPGTGQPRAFAALAAVLTAAWPTATVPASPVPQDGRYENPDLGFSFTYPRTWQSAPGSAPSTLLDLTAADHSAVLVVFYNPLPDGSTLEDAATQLRDEVSAGDTDVTTSVSQAFALAQGQAAWFTEYSATLQNGSPAHVLLVSTAHSGRLITLLAYVDPNRDAQQRRTLLDIFSSLTLNAPQLYGIPRDQALVELGSESNNPRSYDPATSAGNDLVFSGLVSFNPQLQVVPDLAESWDISADGTVYTFHLRPNARFHDGRPVTAQDVIYSWERAADPKTDSDVVLTYLGDIVGVGEKRAGHADHIQGLQALDEHTLQVTIDAPKPYFLMKLTFGSTAIVDRANVESGPDWYRQPNGTGPYKLTRWEPFKEQIYEANPDFYLGPPPIRYVIVQLFAGVGIRLYETGDIDLTGVSTRDVERVRDPQEPLHQDVVSGVSMCTSRVTFDVAQPPFDDPKVRQAFALAVDRQRYLDVALNGVGLPARGLYPPALPGYNPQLRSLDYNPTLARQRLAESRYGSADRLPPIVFTNSAFGSDLSPGLSALIGMWQATLGVDIQVENLEPDKYIDELRAGRHGQLFNDGWCADYPDPENFADVLFHTGAEENLGHYANPAVDALLDQARVERDVPQRMGLYQQAEQLLVDDAASIFLVHNLGYSLVKPQIRSYVWTPIAVPLVRYLSIDPAAFK